MGVFMLVGAIVVVVALGFGFWLGHVYGSAAKAELIAAIGAVKNSVNALHSKVDAVKNIVTPTDAKPSK